jgi:DNA-3-methyladenine glycosylase
MVLTADFYQRPNVLTIARELVGKVIITRLEGATTVAMITETEAYAGITDRASHAWNGRRTARTGVMYAPGGVAYVYLCYGIHHLFNVVTNVQDIPHAVLIRAVEPLEGIETMMLRRGSNEVTPQLTAGPGSLSVALGINTTHSGIGLYNSAITIEDRQTGITAAMLTATPRIGVAYAGADALLPYRFFLTDSPWVSKGKYLTAIP